MSVIKVAQEIEKKIQELDLAKTYLSERSNKRASTISDYDRVLAVTIIKLRNNIIQEFEGQIIKDLPATIIEKVAKGICHKERLEQERADAEYKSLITFISTTESQLNGWQSINKHLEER